MLKYLVSGERGSALPEYALLSACLMMVLLLGIRDVGVKSRTEFMIAGSAMSQAQSDGGSKCDSVGTDCEEPPKPPPED